MVISVLEHGLGNQLFQYATGRALAERLKTSLLLDKMRFAYNVTRDLEITRFRIRARMLPDRLADVLDAGGDAPGWKSSLNHLASRWITTFKDAQNGYDDAVTSLRGNCRLDGFWQSEKYFREIRSRLLEELEPRDPLPAPLQAFVRRVPNEESVAVHVRRGDVTIKSLYATTHGALAAPYYAEALARVGTRFPDARFYVFSDDPDWCEQHLPTFPAIEIVSGKLTRSAVHDLVAMKSCRHFIVGNSTFSWWAAWLGTHPAKHVLAPARFFRVPNGWEKDLRPAGWETLEPTFEEL